MKYPRPRLSAPVNPLNLFPFAPLALKMISNGPRTWALATAGSRHRAARTRPFRNISSLLRWNSSLLRVLQPARWANALGLCGWRPIGEENGSKASFAPLPSHQPRPPGPVTIRHHACRTLDKFKGGNAYSEYGI